MRWPGAHCAWLGLALVAGGHLLDPPSSAVAEAHGLIDALTLDDRRVEIADRLIVNVDPARRYVFPGKCQADGELELAALAAASALEESFIFVPATCTWIEAGRNETVRSVLLDQALLNAVAHQYRNVAVYHIQPGHRPSLASHFPSYRDFVAMVLIDVAFIDAPEIRVQHRAVTEFAVIDYRFADWEAVQRRAQVYRRRGLGAHLGQNLAYEFSRQAHLSSYATQVQMCASRLGDVSSRIGECRRIVTELFILDVRTVQLAGR